MSKQTDTLDAIRERNKNEDNAFGVSDVRVLLAKIDADAKIIAEHEKFRDDLDKAIDKIEDGVGRVADSSAGVLALYEFTKTQLSVKDKLLRQGREIVERDADYWKGKLTNWQRIVSEMNIKDPDLEDAFQERVDEHNEWLKAVADG